MLQSFIVKTKALGLVAACLLWTQFSAAALSPNEVFHAAHQTVMTTQEFSLRNVTQFYRETGYYPGPLPAEYAQAFERLSGTVDAPTQFTTIGKGNNAVVYTDGKWAYKVPTGPGKAPALQMEYLVNAHLKRNYDKYHILTDEIVEIGPSGTYLKKPLLDSRRLGSNITHLSAPQKEALANMFVQVRKYVADTGIGIDLKASNLYWNGSEWMIFDCGPRMSFRPYGFTLDVDRFEDFLKMWQEFDPEVPANGHNLTLAEVEARLPTSITRAKIPELRQSAFSALKKIFAESAAEDTEVWFQDSLRPIAARAEDGHPLFRDESKVIVTTKTSKPFWLEGFRPAVLLGFDGRSEIALISFSGQTYTKASTKRLLVGLKRATPDDVVREIFKNVGEIAPAAKVEHRSDDTLVIDLNAESQRSSIALAHKLSGFSLDYLEFDLQSRNTAHKSGPMQRIESDQEVDFDSLRTQVTRSAADAGTLRYGSTLETVPALSSAVEQLRDNCADVFGRS